MVTGDWTRNRLLQTIVVLYALYVSLLWITNALLYFNKMGLTYASVVSYYNAQGYDNVLLLDTNSIWDASCILADGVHLGDKGLQVWYDYLISIG